LAQHLAPALPWKHLLPLMIDLTARSYKKELLDGNDIPFEAIKQNMKELNIINTLLGGHAISIMGLQKMISQKQQNTNNKPLLVCEIGCGGGDNIKAMNKWCKKNNIAAGFMGIDIKKECIDYAKGQCKDIEASWMVSPYEKVKFEKRPDVIFSSLFCHHFNETELTFMLQWMKNNATTGFFINDLHRHCIAYYSIKLLTRLFATSYLVKNDAPLSVARGFTKKEWLQILHTAGINNPFVQWKWAFRHLITYTNCM
jgi:2-polyprenyl-3-methyl-5-hydroxy-6-metoxy-1,4-benzoquinol methylase